MSEENNIIVSDALAFSKPNCPTRVGELVESVGDIQNIVTPRLGMQVYVKSEDKTYIITELESVTTNGVETPDAKVKSYKLYDPREVEKKLRNLIRGYGDEVDSRNDSFKFLGDFTEYDDSGLLSPSLSYQALDNKLKTLTYANDVIGLNYGYFRATVLNHRQVEIKNLLISSGESYIVQVVSGCFKISNNALAADDNNYCIATRILKKQNAGDEKSTWSEWKVIVDSNSISSLERQINSLGEGLSGSISETINAAIENLIGDSGYTSLKEIKEAITAETNRATEKETVLRQHIDDIKYIKETATITLGGVDSNGNLNEDSTYARTNVLNGQYTIKTSNFFNIYAIYNVSTKELKTFEEKITEYTTETTGSFIIVFRINNNNKFSQFLLNSLSNVTGFYKFRLEWIEKDIININNNIKKINNTLDEIQSSTGSGDASSEDVINLRDSLYNETTVDLKIGFATNFESVDETSIGYCITDILNGRYLIECNENFRIHRVLIKDDNGNITINGYSKNDDKKSYVTDLGKQSIIELCKVDETEISDLSTVIKYIGETSLNEFQEKIDVLSLRFTENLIAKKGALQENGDPYPGTSYECYIELITNGETLYINPGYLIKHIKVIENNATSEWFTNINSSSVVFGDGIKVTQVGIVRADNKSITKDEYSNIVKSFIRNPHIWNTSSNLNNYIYSGEYIIYGDRGGVNDGMPDIEEGTINAKLTVISQDDTVLQKLTIINATTNYGSIFLRTYNENTWGDWRNIGVSSGSSGAQLDLNELQNKVGKLEKFAPENIEWNGEQDIDDYTKEGIYNISGTKTAEDGLPILNNGVIKARLAVLVADNCVTQSLTLLNVAGGESNIYIRTLQNGTWKPWGKLQTNVEVGLIDQSQMDALVDNGIYSGILSTTGETFVIICINNYAIAQQVGVQHISHLKYSLVVGTGEIKIEKRTRDAYGFWTEWENIGGGSEVDVTAIYNAIASEKARAEQAEQEIKSKAVEVDSLNVEQEIDGVKINFATLDNSTSSGDITIPVATTEKAGVMSAEDKKSLDTATSRALRTLFIAAGAEYNDTGADITKTTLWGETVTHKAGHYYLNGLGDITEAQMTKIYNRGAFNDSEKSPLGYDTNKLNQVRTNLCRVGMWNCSLLSYLCAANTIIEVVNLHIINSNILKGTCAINFADTENIFFGASKLSVIDTRCLLSSATWKNSSFTGCKQLKEVRIKSLRNNIVFKDSSVLSKATILYMIQNAAPTTAITITLHPDAYARLAEDADIVAALEAQPLITLVTAE